MGDGDKELGWNAGIFAEGRIAGRHGTLVDRRTHAIGRRQGLVCDWRTAVGPEFSGVTGTADGDAGAALPESRPRVCVGFAYGGERTGTTGGPVSTADRGDAKARAARGDRKYDPVDE